MSVTTEISTSGKKQSLDSTQLRKRREEKWEKLVEQAPDADIRRRMLEYRERGFCIVPRVFNKEIRDLLLDGADFPVSLENNEKCQRPTRRVRLLKDAWFGARRMIHLNREMGGGSCAPRSKGRFDFQLPPTVLPRVHDILEEGGVMKLLYSICPNAKIRTENVMLAEPGAEQQPIHIDSSWRGCAHTDPLPHYLTVLIPLVRQTSETGGTRVWPGTHRKMELTASDVPEPLDMIEPRLKVGDALIFDGLLAHCGMENKSTDVDRYFFYLAFSTRHDPNTELTAWT